MSKFKTFFENILTEYDRDDPTDNFWQAAKDFKAEQRNKLQINTIKPVQKNDFVYIKIILKYPENFVTKYIGKVNDKYKIL